MGPYFRPYKLVNSVALVDPRSLKQRATSRKRIIVIAPGAGTRANGPLALNLWTIGKMEVFSDKQTKKSQSFADFGWFLVLQRKEDVVCF